MPKKERLLEFDKNWLYDSLKESELYSHLKVFLEPLDDPNHDLWASEKCQFMATHGLRHVRNVFRYATRLYWDVVENTDNPSRDKDFLSQAIDRLCLIVSIWLHDWGMAGPEIPAHLLVKSEKERIERRLEMLNETLEVASKKLGRKISRAKNSKFPCSWVRPNHHLVSYFNITKAPSTIGLDIIEPRLEKYGRNLEDVATICLFHRLPLKKLREFGREHLSGLCALLGFLDGCDENWQRLISLKHVDRLISRGIKRGDKWYESIDSTIHSNMLRLIGINKKDVEKLRETWDKGEMEEVLDTIDYLLGTYGGKEPIIELEKDVEYYYRTFVLQYEKHIDPKSLIEDVYFKNGEIILVPRHMLISGENPAIQETIRRIRKHLQECKVGLKKLGLQYSVSNIRLWKPDDGDPRNLEIPEKASELAIANKHHLRLLTPHFIDRVRAVPASLEKFYQFTDPSWSDIVNDFDVPRSNLKRILYELNRHRERFIFLPILAPCGEGKSTFLRRLAYELYLTNELVFYLEIDPSMWHINLEQMVSDLQELAKTKKRKINLLIDNCFRFNIETLILDIASDPFPINIVGTSQIIEYRSDVHRYKQTILKRNKPFHLSPLSPEEISSLIDRLILHKVIEPQERAALLRKCKSKVYLTDLIPELLPSNRFEIRIKELLGKIKTSKNMFTAYKYISLAYQFGLKMPLSILAKLTHKNEEDIVQEISQLGEILIGSIKGKYVVRLRHEKWAVESIKILFPKRIGIVKRYQSIVDSIDETSAIERQFIVNLLTRLSKSERRALARKVYFSRSFLDKLESIENPMTLKQLVYWHLDYWIPLRLILREATLGDINIIKELLDVALETNPNDPKLYFKYMYFNFLENKYVDRHDMIIRKLTDISPLTWKNLHKDYRSIMNKIMKTAFKEENYEPLLKMFLHRMSFHPSSYEINTGLVAPFIGLLSIMGKYKEIKYIFDNLDFPLFPSSFLSLPLLYKKADFYFETQEYEKAYSIYKSCSDLGYLHKNKDLKLSYQRFLLHYDYNLALQEIEREEKENPRKAFYLRVELYLIHSKKQELKALWKNYDPRVKTEPPLKYIWYIVSLAFLGKYDEAKGHIKKISLRKRYSLGKLRYIARYATHARARRLASRYSRVAFFYLGKFFAQSSDNLAHAYKWLQISRELAIVQRRRPARTFYTIRIDKEIDSLKPALKSFCLEKINQSKDDYAINLKYAQILDEIGHERDARKQFEKALELNPVHAEANNQLANFLKERLHDYSEAEKYYRRAIEYDSQKRESQFPIPNPKYLNNLALLFIETMRVEKFVEAENLLLKANQVGFRYAQINLDKLNAIKTKLSDKQTNLS